MEPNWADGNCNIPGYKVRALLGNMVEIWEYGWSYDDAGGGGFWERFCCFITLDEAKRRTSIQVGKHWPQLDDEQRRVARYFEAKELGLIDE